VKIASATRDVRVLGLFVALSYFTSLARDLVLVAFVGATRQLDQVATLTALTVQFASLIGGVLSYRWTMRQSIRSIVVSTFSVLLIALLLASAFQTQLIPVVILFGLQVLSPMSGVKAAASDRQFSFVVANILAPVLPILWWWSIGKPSQSEILFGYAAATGIAVSFAFLACKSRPDLSKLQTRNIGIVMLYVLLSQAHLYVIRLWALQLPSGSSGMIGIAISLLWGLVAILVGPLSNQSMVGRRDQRSEQKIALLSLFGGLGLVPVALIFSNLIIRVSPDAQDLSLLAQVVASCLPALGPTCFVVIVSRVRENMSTNVLTLGFCFIAGLVVQSTAFVILQTFLTGWAPAPFSYVLGQTAVALLCVFYVRKRRLDF
jgi:hypothetical protein